MESLSNVDQSAIITDNFEQPSWQRVRSTDELLGFIARREAVVLNTFDGDLFS